MFSPVGSSKPGSPKRGVGRSRRSIAVTFVIVAASLLSGCTAFSSFARDPGDTASQPALGDCWRGTYSAALDDYTWTGKGRVACALSHQLYSYAVVKVTSSAPTWTSSSTGIDDTVYRDVAKACDDRFSALIRVLPPDSRLVKLWFIAPESQWKKGARWARCDLGVLKAGSSFAHPALATLPSQIGVLFHQVQSNPNLFADCVMTSDPSGNLGPYDDPKATIADCTKDYQWRLQNFFDMGLSDVYPSDDAISAIGQLRCGDEASSDQDWITYVPTEDQWSSGDHSGECWFYREKTTST